MLRSCLQMENSLRLIVLGAQCLAGSWRKNGLTLLQQVIFEKLLISQLLL